MNRFVEVIKEELTKLKKMLKQTGTDYTATVTRVDGNTAYVQMSGSAIADTPVSMTINAHVGDKVRVRVSNGRAWITGNDTAPPSDNKQVIEMIENNSQGLIETEAKYSRIDQTIDNITLQVGEKMDSDMSNRASSISIDSGKIEFNSNTLVVNSDNFTLDDDGNSTFGGTLNAAGGTFEGTVRINADYDTGMEQTIILTSDELSPMWIYHSTYMYEASAKIGATRIYMEENDMRGSTTKWPEAAMTASYIKFVDIVNGGSNHYTHMDKDMLKVRNNNSWTDYMYDGAHPSSDIRLKEDITKIDPETAKHLLPVRFRFKGDDKLHYGFIAQDVQKVIPDVVDESTDGYLTLTYHELIAPLYALVQEQEKRIEALEKQLKGGDQ